MTKQRNDRIGDAASAPAPEIINQPNRRFVTVKEDERKLRSVV